MDVRIQEHEMKTGYLGAKNPPISDLMRELFDIYGALLRDCGGPSATEDDVSWAANFAARLDVRQASRVTEKYTILLSEFYQKYGAALRETAYSRGGVNVLAELPTATYDARVCGAVSLFADTIIVCDPVAYWLLDFQTDYYQKLPCAWRSAQAMLHLRPLAEAALAIPPLVVFRQPRENAEVEGYTARRIEARRYGDAPTWSRIGMEIAQQRKAQDSFAALRALEMVDYLRRQLFYCDELHAEPLFSGPDAAAAYRIYARQAAENLVQHGYLSKEAVMALRAIQHTEFDWLQNVSIAAIPAMLQLHEHLVFRERLEKQMKVLQGASLSDLSLAVIQVKHALARMVEEHNADQRRVDRKYLSKHLSVAGGGAMGAVIAGGVCLISPKLGYPFGDAMTLAIGGGTALGAAGKAVGNWVSGALEQTVEKRIAQRTLFGLIAKVHPTT